MFAEIITIGDEILIGQIVDTNSAWLGEELNKIGVKIFQITSISDSRQHIIDTVMESMERSDVVIITGGLGPTKDDITKLTLAEMFGMQLVKDEATYLHIEKMMKVRGYAFNGLNQSQAMVPDGCTVIPNANGTAPGMWFERKGKVIISMPGVPFEMKAMMSSEIIPRLKEHFNLHSIVHKTAITFGLAESILAETIAEWENALPDYLHLAYLPSPKGVRLRLSAYEVDGEKAATEIDSRFMELEKIIPQYIVGYNDASIEGALGEMLRTRGETVSTAESCTGGNIAHKFTLIPGSSDYFVGSVVSYSNDIKTNVLGVSREDIEKEGAVSETVAKQMADGVRRITGSTYAISTTGIAGPTGGTPEKPVGTVWMAISTPQGTFAQHLAFGSLREQNIQRFTSAALDMLRVHMVNKVTGKK